MTGSELDLRHIIFPLDFSTFQKEFFQKKPLLVERNNLSYFEQLLSLDLVNTYLERKDIRYPSIRMVKNGLEFPQNYYLNNHPWGKEVFERIIDNDRLFALFAEG